MSNYINFPIRGSDSERVRETTERLREAFDMPTRKEARNFFLQQDAAQADLIELEKRMIAEARAQGYDLVYYLHDGYVFQKKEAP